MKKLLLFVVFLVAIISIGKEPKLRVPQTEAARTEASSAGDEIIAAAFSAHQSDVAVRGGGSVMKILADDNDGIRHQRFILRLGSGQTLLVAHNIDLAQRIASLQVGDQVEFQGTYEWNPKGGVIHRTHHDPRGNRSAGWIKHHGRIYQ